MRWIWLFLLLGLLVLAVSNVQAIAFASDYLENNTLVVIEETSSIYSIRLQNPYSYEIKVEVYGEDVFMKMIDPKEEYIIQPGDVEKIEFNITAPKYDKEGNNWYTMSYSVHQLTGPPGEGGIPLMAKMGKNFKVKVIEDPNKFHINWFHTAVAAILIVVLYFLIRKRKN
jgi:hypothetical protein